MAAASGRGKLTWKRGAWALERTTCTLTTYFACMVVGYPIEYSHVKRRKRYSDPKPAAALHRPGLTPRRRRFLGRHSFHRCRRAPLARDGHQPGIDPHAGELLSGRAQPDLGGTFSPRDALPTPLRVGPGL